MAKRHEAFEPPPVDREITIAEGITVKELSEKLGVKATLVIKRLLDKKILANINQTLDVKLAEELARDFGASTNQVSYEQETTHEIEQTEVEADALAARTLGAAPVKAFLQRVLVLTKGQNWEAKHRFEVLQ